MCAGVLQKFFRPMIPPVLDFWWYLLRISRARVTSFIRTLAKAYTLYIFWDSPLLLHLLTSWRPTGCHHSYSILVVWRYLLTNFRRQMVTNIFLVHAFFY